MSASLSERPSAVFRVPPVGPPVLLRGTAVQFAKPIMTKSAEDSSIPALTEGRIRQWAGDKFFRRGLDYYRNHAILHPCRQGTTLKAQCLGSRPRPYHLRLSLSADGIATADCSCPVGHGCKHLVALLLTWVHEPGQFQEEETPDALLERYDKPALISLIKQMLDQAPGLEDLLHFHALGQRPLHQAIEPEVIQCWAERILDRSRYNDWEEEPATGEVQGGLNLGNDFAARGDWHNAAIVYAVFAKTFLADETLFYGEEIDTLEPATDGVTGLGLCLANTQDPGDRAYILRALFDLYSWDIKMGGLGVGDEIPGILEKQATAEEKAEMAQWIRKTMAARTRSGHCRVWEIREYGGLLLILEAANLDDEAYLRLCRESGRFEDLLERLLVLGRVEEARSLVATGPFQQKLLYAADRFLAHGQEPVILDLIRARAAASGQGAYSYKKWLKNYALDRQRPEEALTLAEEMFWTIPRLSAYQDMQALAEPLQRWEALREATLQQLAQKPRFQELRIKLLLAEDRIADALQALAACALESGLEMGHSLKGDEAPLRLRVAQAAEPEFPEQAVDLYLRAVEALIGQRGRKNYAEAAKYLVRVRKLYPRIGKDPELFRAQVRTLRAEHRRLRALKEELARVGL